ncbi:MAG: hypothetical protein Q9170_007949 [Blastenia crenularia]
MTTTVFTSVIKAMKYLMKIFAFRSDLRGRVETTNLDSGGSSRSVAGTGKKGAPWVFARPREEDEMSLKRKAAQAAAAQAANESSNQSSKRRKVSPPLQETVETTTETGLRCLERIKNARDKKEWPIATHFLALPDKAKNKKYYQEIGLPISLDIIEAKLKNHEYPTVTTVESDLRRMIFNAKSYNDKASQLFSDAEKIRKAVSNFMVENNPAYQTADYKPFPTPVPDDWQARLSKEEKEEAEAESKDEVARSTRGISTRRASSVATGPSNVRASASPGEQDNEGLGENFDNDTFQRAQEKIVAEMMNLKNEDDELIMGPFIHLPSRELRDYYRVIKRPVSLKSVQKAVQGVKGREKPTGISNFKSWATFEEETSCIWKNAYHYNEDGSDISEAATVLRDYFYQRLEEAKRVVAEPPQPKVRLRMPAKSPDPPKIPPLKFGRVSVDSEALKRQQDLVNAGMNGQASIRAGPKNPLAGSQQASIPNGVPSLQRMSQERRSGSAEKPAINGVKTEHTIGQSPALGTVQMSTERSGSLDARQSPHPGMMPPPPVTSTPRLPSGSPHLSSYSTNHYNSTGYSSTESTRRQSGKEALLTNLSVSTHPGLKIDKHFHLNIPPSPTTTQHSITITLPSTNYYLQLTPTLAPSVIQRPYKIFATVNNNRIHPNPQRPEESDARRPLYEHRVMPGMNRIEVEIVAGMPRGAPKVGTGPELEVEKITIFAHLVKS